MKKKSNFKAETLCISIFSSLNNILWLKNNMFKISRHILWIICWQSSTRNNIKTKMGSLKTSLGPSTFQFIQQMRFLFINSFVDIFILKNGNYSILSVCTVCTDHGSIKKHFFDQRISREFLRAGEACMDSQNKLPGILMNRAVLVLISFRY